MLVSVYFPFSPTLHQTHQNSNALSLGNDVKYRPANFLSSRSVTITISPQQGLKLLTQNVLRHNAKVKGFLVSVSFQYILCKNLSLRIFWIDFVNLIEAIRPQLKSCIKTIKDACVCCFGSGPLHGALAVFVLRDLSSLPHKCQDLRRVLLIF